MPLVHPAVGVATAGSQPQRVAGLPGSSDQARYEAYLERVVEEGGRHLWPA